MNHNLARRLLICLAAGFFIVSTFFTIGCAGSRIKVEYEKDDSTEYSEENSEYSETDHKYKHKKGGPPPCTSTRLSGQTPLPVLSILFGLL